MSSQVPPESNLKTPMERVIEKVNQMRTQLSLAKMNPIAEWETIHPQTKEHLMQLLRMRQSQEIQQMRFQMDQERSALMRMKTDPSLPVDLTMRLPKDPTGPMWEKDPTTQTIPSPDPIQAQARIKRETPGTTMPPIFQVTPEELKEAGIKKEIPTPETKVDLAKVRKLPTWEIHLILMLAKRLVGPTERLADRRMNEAVALSRKATEDKELTSPEVMKVLKESLLANKKATQATATLAKLGAIRLELHKELRRRKMEK